MILRDVLTAFDLWVNLFSSIRIFLLHQQITKLMIICRIKFADDF